MNPETERAIQAVTKPSGDPAQPDPAPTSGIAIHALVMADLADRLALGIRRYGTPLQAGNGRDALWDAYEEALDLACYLRTAIEETKKDAR